MSASSRAAILKRLIDEHQAASAGAGLGPVAARCERLAQQLPLGHSMPSKKFADLAADRLGVGWKLLSPQKLAEHGVDALRAGSAEVQLGTTRFVFLYCGQFRIPDTQVGFLFRVSLEEARGGESEASPFDSGGLARRVEGPDAAVTAAAFLRRYPLPVPGYREFLAQRLHWLFVDPVDYMRSAARPIRQDLIGLRPRGDAPPDAREWTFEMRVADEVALAQPHLMAAFYLPRRNKTTEARSLLAHLAGSGAMARQAIPEDDSDHGALQRCCLAYLQSEGIVRQSA